GSGIGERTHRSPARVQEWTTSWLNQALTDGVPDDTGGAVDVELLHDSKPILLGGSNGDPEKPGDLLRRLALGQELQNLPFARRQRIGSPFRLGRMRLHHSLRDAGAQVDSPSEHLIDRPHQVRSRLGLRNIALDPGPARLKD